MATTAEIEVLSSSVLEEMIPKLKHELEQGEAHEEHIKSVVEDQREENKRIRKLLSIVDPDYEHPNATRKKGRSQGTHVGQTRQEWHGDRLRNLEGEGRSGLRCPSGSRSERGEAHPASGM